MTGILVATKDPHPEIMETAFKALRDGMPAMNSLLSNGGFREYLIAQLVETLGNSAMAELSLQALLEFVRNYFPCIQSNYMNVFLSRTAPILQNPQ